MNSQDIVLSEDEQTELSRRIRSATISQRDGRRARVILLAARGCSRNEIAQLTGLSVVSVTRWCKRFQELRLQGLVDLPGRGRKPSLPAEALKRTLEQVTQPRIGQPRWSCRSMARVAGISPASVQRIWAANDIKPHLTRTFNCPAIRTSKRNFGTSLGCSWIRRIRHWCSVAMKKARFRPSNALSLDCLWESGISARNRTIMSAMVPLPCSPRWIIFRGI